MRSFQQLEDQAAEDLRSLAVLRAAVSHRQQVLADEEHDARLQAPGATDRAADARLALVSAQDTLGAREALAADVQRELQAARKMLDEAADLSRLRSIPRLHRECQAQADLVTEHAVELAKAINTHVRLAIELGAAIGTPEAKRSLSPGPIAMRLQCTLAQVMVYDHPPGPGQIARGPTGTPIRWLPWPLQHASPLFGVTFAKATNDVLETQVEVFDSEASAQAAQKRRSPPLGQKLHVLDGLSIKPGLFFLIASKLRGRAALDEPRTQKEHAP